jgi:hypothetical protein
MNAVGIGSDCRNCRVGHCDEWDYIVGDGGAAAAKNLTKDLFMILYYEERYLL